MEGLSRRDLFISNVKLGNAPWVWFNFKCARLYSKSLNLFVTWAFSPSTAIFGRSDFQLPSCVSFLLRSSVWARSGPSGMVILTVHGVGVLDLTKLAWEDLGKLVGDALTHLNRHLQEGHKLLFGYGLGRAVGMKELQQACCCFLESVLVATCHIAHIHAGVDVRLKIATSQFGEDLRHVVGQQPIPNGVILWANLRHLPARQVGVDTIQEGRVLQLNR